MSRRAGFFVPLQSVVPRHGFDRTRPLLRGRYRRRGAVARSAAMELFFEGKRSLKRVTATL